MESTGRSTGEVAAPASYLEGIMAQRQDVLDALADAETLRRNINVRDRARREALATMDINAASLRRLIGQCADADYGDAVKAAHAAFRAVPGLRGSRTTEARR